MKLNLPGFTHPVSRSRSAFVNNVGSYGIRLSHFSVKVKRFRRVYRNFRIIRLLFRITFRKFLNYLFDSRDIFWSKHEKRAQTASGFELFIISYLLWDYLPIPFSPGYAPGDSIRSTDALRLTTSTIMITREMISAITTIQYTAFRKAKADL